MLGSEESADWIKRRRTSMHLTQRQLSKKAGMHEDTLRAFERGAVGDKTPLAQYVKLAEALEIELGYFMFKMGLPMSRDGVDMDRVARAEAIGEAYGVIEEKMRRSLAEAVHALGGTLDLPPDPTLHDRLQDALATLDFATGRLAETGYLVREKESTAGENPVKFWRPEEREFLRVHPNLSHQEAAMRLGRTTEAVRFMRKQLGKENEVEVVNVGNGGSTDE